MMNRDMQRGQTERAMDSHWMAVCGCIQYFVFLLLFTIILFAVGIAVYVYKDQAEYYISQGWANSPGVVLQGLEALFDCCGLAAAGQNTGFVDPPYNSSSCPDTYQFRPCLPLMVDVFKSSYQTAGACGIAFAVIMVRDTQKSYYIFILSQFPFSHVSFLFLPQLCGMFFVCYLMVGIKRKAEEVNIAKLRTGATIASDDPNMDVNNFETGESEDSANTVI